MSLCNLGRAARLRVGTGATVVGLLLYQIDGLKAVEALHLAAPMHFVQGLFLGVGLAAMLSVRLTRKGL